MSLDGNGGLSLGLDGGYGGWLVARIQWRGDQAESLECVRWAKPETIARLPARTPVCVDMPIGLLDRGRPGGRPCDMAARQLLGRRSASVFSPPVRPALEGVDFEDAQAIHRSHSQGLGISRQSYNLLPHIRALDAWITPPRQKYVREAHPELIFQRLNSGLSLPGKRGPEGKELRRHLLERRLSGEVLWGGLSSLPGKFHIDAMDAIACALTAHDLTRGKARSLGDGSLDSKGLRMEICC